VNLGFEGSNSVVVKRASSVRDRPVVDVMATSIPATWSNFGDGYVNILTPRSNGCWVA
jgi:hypothetical protein